VQQAIDTMRRSKGIDVVFIFAQEGAVFAAWHRSKGDAGPFRAWLSEWLHPLTADESAAGSILGAWTAGSCASSVSASQ